MRLGPWEWLRIARRGGALAGLVFGGLGLLLLVRLVERPFFGVARPWTPSITQRVCRMAFVLIGIDHRTLGQPMRLPGACVANHSSWLDIFALNAHQPIYFVAKSEVFRWPGIGWLARATGTLFIRRDRREASVQTRCFQERLRAGHTLLFFPEGTSTDGRRVLDFVPTLFQAFFADDLRETLRIQPITVIYTAPDGADPRHYGWWGEMDFAGHLLMVLATPRQGQVEVIYHTPIQVAEAQDRKDLARLCRARVAPPLEERCDVLR